MLISDATAFDFVTPVRRTQNPRTVLYTCSLQFSRQLWEEMIVSLRNSPAVRFDFEDHPDLSDNHRTLLRVSERGPWAVVNIVRGMARGGDGMSVVADLSCELPSDDLNARTQGGPVSGRTSVNVQVQNIASDPELIRRVNDMVRGSMRGSVPQQRDPDPRPVATILLERFIETLAVTCKDDFTANMDVYVDGEPATIDLNVTDEGRAIKFKVGGLWVDMDSSSLFRILIDDKMTKGLAIDPTIPVKRKRRSLEE